jgi:transcriptional regulator with XRE-family HTH domain
MRRKLIDTKVLIKLRVNQKLTLEYVGLEVGLSAGHLSRIESGKLKNVSVDTASRLAKFYEVSIESLLKEEEEKKWKQ